jgi:hypothetical protein
MEQRGFPTSPEGLEIIRDIADQVNKDDRRGLTFPELRMGVVTAINLAVAPPECDVLLGNNTDDEPATAIPCGLGYLPVVNDVIFLLKNGTDLIAIGGFGTLADFGVETVSTGLTPASGFGTTQFLGRKTAGVTTVMVRMDRTGGTITATNANITDTLVCTLPVGWRPPDTVFPAANIQNARTGVMEVLADGTCVLVTSTTDVVTGDSIKFSHAWIS